MGRLLAVVLAVAMAVPAGALPHPDAPACEIFPADNVWRADVSSLPVHPRSGDWVASMGGPARRLHPDFGPSDGPQPYGIPFEVVPGDHPKVSLSFLYEDESDPGPYPFDADTPIEGLSDRHALMLDRDACVLYELYDAEHDPSGSTAGSGAIFDLTSNALRPPTWTSADAAGLPIFPGLIRRDEVEAGAIDHAIRMTASRTDRRFVWPARHQAGAADDPTLPPMGARFRLKAGFDLDGYLAETRVILRAMRTHGLIVADNGSDWYFGGAAEDGWDTEVLDELKSIPAAAFEAVDTSSLKVDPDSGQAKLPVSLSSSLARRRIRAGRATTITGDVTPPHPGQQVVLKRRRDGRWRTVDRRTLTSGGFSFRVRPRRTAVYRAFKPADGDHHAAAGRTLRLRVRSG
ncbi:MAG TPA: hypothetical protein VGB28_04050 [Actinomycetota bacterium]|jgi:hypothetical protein